MLFFIAVSSVTATADACSLVFNAEGRITPKDDSRGPFLALIRTRWRLAYGTFEPSRSSRRLCSTDQAMAVGVGDGVGAVGGAGLAKDVADVPTHCVQRDDELVGDLLVGASSGEETQHLELSR